MPGLTPGVLGEYAEFGEWSLAYCPVIDDATMPGHPIAALTDTGLDRPVHRSSRASALTLPAAI